MAIAPTNERPITKPENGIQAAHRALKSKMKNCYAWGSVRPDDGMIILNAWESEVVDGWVVIHKVNTQRANKANYKERIGHCDALLQDAKGLAILCPHKADKHDNWSIKTLPCDQYAIWAIKEVKQRDDGTIWAKLKPYSRAT